MTTFYMDPVGGNDANAGTSFANRWKTFTSGGTAARLAPGDTIRYIASPAPTSLGNATWTNGSRTITLATACNLTIDNCETNWTPSANVTASLDTSLFKQGTHGQSLAIASGFTTGLVAYSALPGTLDLSTYEQVSLYFRATTTVAAASLELRLCTDALGVTGVHTIPLTEAACITNAWHMVVKDFAAGMNNAIQSIAVYATIDPGTVTIVLDNIIACKASSAAASLTHTSLIGKQTAGEPEWWPIMSIDGVTVSLGSAPADIPTTARNYNGTTETVTTYKIQPIELYNGGGTSPAGLTANTILQDTGSVSSTLTISGGWDRAAMSTQSGETWVTGSGKATTFLDINTRSYVEVSNFGVAHFNTTAIIGSAATHCVVTQLGAAGCLNGGSLAFYNSNARVNFGNIVHCSIGVLAGTASSDFFATVRRITGSSGATSWSRGVNGGSVGHAFVSRIDNGLKGYTCNASDDGQMFFYNTTFDSNTTADVDRVNSGQTVMVNCTLSSSTPMTGNITTPDCLSFQNYGGVANDHRQYRRGASVVTDTGTVHGSSAMSWKLTFDAFLAYPTYLPFLLPMFRYAAAAGVAKTFGLWVRRSDLSMSVGIFIRGGKVPGITTDVTSYASGAINTWEQVTATVTPSVDAVIEVFGSASSASSTYTAYFDDASVT